MLEYLFIFLCGFFIEVLNVLWVHFSESGLAGKTTICTLVVNLANIYCLSRALQDDWKRLTFVAALGLGAYCTVRGKEWFKRRGNSCLTNKSITRT